MPKDTLVQTLYFIADNERFSCINENLTGGISVEEVRSALRELAREIAKEAYVEQGDELKNNAHLSRKAKEIISYLSPNEEKTLLSAFGVAKPK